MERLVFVALAAAVLYCAVATFFFVQQRALLFPAPQRYLPPSAAGLVGVSEAPLVTPDGETVMTWEAGDAGAGDRVILFFHGNGDSLPNLASHATYWRGRGWRVVLSTYRGYPGSTGKPSEAALRADALAIFDRIVAGGTSPEDVVVGGGSLGSAVAVAVAADRRTGGVFLQAPPSAIDEVASHHYPWLPVRPLMRDRFRSIDRIARVDAPVFIVHGDADNVVPLRFVRRLFDAAQEPKRLLVLPGTGHVLGPDVGWPEFERFLAEDPAQRSAARQAPLGDRS